MDKIVIEVVEAVPVGVVPIGGDYAVLDTDSKVLEVTPVQPLDLVLLSGCSVTAYEPGAIAVFESDESAALIATVMEALEKVGLLEDTVELNVEKRYDIVFRYGEYYTCELGDVEKLDSKLQMILKVMESNPDDVTATIDASDANKVYYRPQYE
jgi:cell division septal protein FtsQ